MTIASRFLPWAAAGLALLTAGVARAETHIPPCTGTCTPPVVDGDVDDLEYANGIGFPLSNFAAGGPNGSLRLVLIGEVLHVGLRVPVPVDSNRGEVKLFLDAERPDTSCSPVAEKPESVDRRLTILYDLTGAGTASIGQMVGNGTGWGLPTGPLGFLRYWPTSMALTRPASDPGMIHLEVAITLRQANADESQVLADEELGFALHHLASGADEHLPGGAGQVPGVAAPCGWETLAFGLEDPVPLSIATWRLNAYEPEDVAAVVADRDVQCLVQVDEDSDKDDLIEAVDKIREPAPPVTPIVYPWSWDDPVHASDDPNLILSNLPVIASGAWSKQAVWARVLTQASVPGPDGTVFDAGEFIDVFCIRQDAGNLEPIAAWIESVRASDRPALVMGYIFDQSPFDLSLTPFEQANEWLSDEHELEGAPYGDNIEPWSEVLVLPARDDWPTFGIAKEPTAVDNSYWDDDGDQIGDMETAAKIQLVRTDQPGHWNPKKPHKVTYRVSRLVDHDSGGCCADWFTKAIQLGGTSKSISDDDTPDGTDVDPGWSVATTLSSGSTTASVEVWEWDTTGDDLYDATPEPLDWIPRFLITHQTGRIERINSLNQVVQTLGTFEAHPDGMGVETKGNGGAHATAFHVFTAEETN